MTRILVVTNDSEKAERLRGQLASRGFDPHAAAYGSTLLEKALAQAPDVLLADLEGASSRDLAELARHCRELGFSSVVYFGPGVVDSGVREITSTALVSVESLFALDEALGAVGQTLSTATLRQVIADERARAATALEQVEGRYRTLFEYGPDGILIADSQSYYLDANPSMCRMLGYTREEFIGKHALDILLTSEISHIEPTLRELNANQDHARVWQFRRKDGSVFEGDTIATMMPDGRLLAMIRDITERNQRERERRHALQELRSSEERFRLLAETIGDVFWITDPLGRYVEYLSPAFDVLWRRPRQNFRPGIWLDTVHPDDRERVRQAFRGRIRGDFEELEYRIIRRYPLDTRSRLPGAQ